MGCGARPLPAPAGPDKAAADEARPLPEPGRFYTPGLPTFGDAKGLPTTATERSLRTLLGRALVPPPALDCVAREYAARFAADGKDPDMGTVAAFARHCGYWSQPAKALTVTASSPAELDQALRRLPLQNVGGALGLGAVLHPDGKATASLLVSPEQIRVDALSRTAPTTVRGRAFTGGTGLELWVDDGRRLELKVQPGGEFEGQIPAGTKTVEFARATGRFRRTLAVAELGVQPERYTRSPAAVADADVHAALAAALNARRTTPLKPVTRLNALLDDWLERVAAGGAGDAPEGLRDDRGWPYARLHFGVTAGQDAAQAMALLDDTPTGRSLIRGDDVAEVAVGLRRYPGGLDAIVVTLQSFQLTKADEAHAALLKGLNDARRAGGLEALAPARILTAEAQAVAAQVLAGEVKWRDSVPAVMERIKIKKLARGGFGAGGYTALDPNGAAFAKQPQAMAPTMKHVGIGVVAGPLPGGGSPRYVVVFVVAERLPDEKPPQG